MPYYDFFCPDCSKKFELSLKIKELEGKHPCPHCGRTNIQREWTFKGFTTNEKNTSAPLPCGKESSCCPGGSCPHKH